MNMISRIVQVCERRSSLVTSVYTNVCLGLGALSATCIGIRSLSSISTMVGLSRLAIIPTIAIPLIINSLFYRMSNYTAMVLFYSYTATLGALICPILYTISSSQLLIAMCMTGGLFAIAMYLARNVEIESTDMKLMQIGLIVLILMSLANIFLRLTVVELLISVAGMAIFVGLTANEIANFQDANVRSGTNLEKISYVISLSLVSKLVNIFIYAVRFLSITGIGRDRD